MCFGPLRCRSLDLLPRCLLTALVALVMSSGAAMRGEDATTDAAIDFNRDVRPILANHCFACHGPDANHREAGLRLDERTAAIDAGAIVPGEPEMSPVVLRIFAENVDERMPPVEANKDLSAQQKQILQRWIAAGAPYMKHWAFEPPQRVNPPEVPGSRHPIDSFVQQRLLADGLTPSPRASAETLIRRVSLDLIGLPPTLAEIDAFVAASQWDAELAYTLLVDRLLASPHYGERWGRWWLDQARYADSNGYSIDAPREIWPFRDWVTHALNADMPFDEFTLQQIAGDLLPDANESQQVATGFHRNTQINQEGGIDPEQYRMDSIFDRVATTGTVWLGLTIGCAQCHDHKFDPLTQREYYELFAFLNNQEEPTLNVYGDPEALKGEIKAAKEQLEHYLDERAIHVEQWSSALSDEDKARLSKSVQEALAEAPSLRSLAQKQKLYVAGPGANDAEYTERIARMADLQKQLDGVATTLIMRELTTPRQTHILIKGDFTRPSDEVSPGTPQVLHPLEATSDRPNRVDLARWLTSRQNPLTARVMVNRVWQQYFGRGIVETENDFGAQGTPPTHPELLDWLAVEFMRSGWRLKHLHRRIVTSHTYQQSSTARDDLRDRDPHNYLLARQQRLRLDAELIRDVCLSASDLLSEKMGGPPVFPPIPDGVMDVGQVKRAWKVSASEDRYRRGYYTFVYRATPPPSLNVFDAPDGYSTCTRRIRSNTPLQALTLLNDSAQIEFAQALERIIHDEGLHVAFRRCTGRHIQPDELAVLQTLDTLSAARVLLNLDETITRE